MRGLTLRIISVNQQSTSMRSASVSDWNQRAFASGVSSAQPCRTFGFIVPALALPHGYRSFARQQSIFYRLHAMEAMFPWDQGACHLPQ